jgi:uncharacterized membrane protein YdjX (TVP38/TMEM64 family)
MRRLLRPLALVALLAAALAAGRTVRTELGLELSPESVRDFVAGLGWKAPALFVTLVTFRQFLALPSGLLLSVGGLCFGAAMGTLLGASGIVVSAFLGFFLARTLGREWARSNLGPRLERLEAQLAAAGPPVVALATAHPLGMMTPIHWGAGLTSIPVLGFAAAVLFGGPIRAATYSFLGSTLLDLGSPEFWLATGILAALVVLPLLHPGVRRRLLGLRRPRAQA